MDVLPAIASRMARSFPMSPLPRKGTITPGVSTEYMRGSVWSFNGVEVVRVRPGRGDVLSAFAAVGDLKRTLKFWLYYQKAKTLRTTFNDRPTQRI